MKSVKILFLFFIFLIFITTKSYCQINDSISHYSELIQNPKNSNDLALAYRFFLKKKNEYSEKRLIKNEIYATQNIADIQKQLGYIDESERLNIECLELLDLLEVDEWSTDSKVKTINDLGKIYRHNKDYKEALKIYSNGLKLAKKKSDVNIILNNIGFVFLQKNELQQALKYFDSAYKKAIENKDTLNAARSLDNLGVTKSKMKKDEAEEDLIEALNIRKKENYSSGIAHSYENLARHFYSVKDSIRALFYSDKVIYLANKTNNLEQIESALRLKIDIGDDFVIREYINIRDSIDDIKEADRSNFNYYVYQYDKKEKELQKSKLRNERMGDFVIYIILISTFLYFILKSKHKKDKIREAYLKETELSKKVHDELANDMSDLMNYVENEIEVSNDKKILLLDNLEDVYLRTRDISTETGSIDFRNFSRSLSYLLLQHNRQGTKVVINDISTISWEKVPDHKKMVVFRCLQELMVNMKKHSKAKLVSIVFKENKSKKEIRYVDNGIGISVDEVKLSGLLNVESRIKSIQGRFNFTTSKGNGFKATLKFNS